MFERFAQAVYQLKDRLKGKRALNEKEIDESLDLLNKELLASDVPYDIAQKLTTQVREALKGAQKVAGLRPAEQITKFLFDRLLVLLGESGNPFEGKEKHTVIMVGLQGSGKTTTLGKLADLIRRKNSRSKILLSSLDFQRPAARAQLAILAQRIGATYYETKADTPLEAAREIIAYRNAHTFHFVGIDTAGRLHTEDDLLLELQQVVTLVKPDHKILVLDGMTGQAALQVAQEFERAIGITGAIISKADSNAPVGASVAFRATVKKPIFFLGTGERLQDLEPFIPKRIAQRLLGEGDIESLIERAQEYTSSADREAIEKAVRKGKFTLNDFEKQLSMVSKIGSLSSLAKYVPLGMGLKMTDEQIQQGEKEMRKFKAIIGSMTLKERVMPSILNNSRKMRIAQGAGVAKQDIQKLLESFEQIQGYVTLLKSGNVSHVKPRYK